VLDLLDRLLDDASEALIQVAGLVLLSVDFDANRFPGTVRALGVQQRRSLGADAELDRSVRARPSPTLGRSRASSFTGDEH